MAYPVIGSSSSLLPGRQRVDRLGGARIQVAVEAVELLVLLDRLRARRHRLLHGVPGVDRHVRAEPGGEKGGAVAGADRLRPDLLRASGDVGDELRPQPTLRPAPDRDDPADVAARGLDRLDVVTDAVPGRLQR